jgi:hypothetical protein
LYGQHACRLNLQKAREDVGFLQNQVYELLTRNFQEGC